MNNPKDLRKEDGLKIEFFSETESTAVIKFDFLSNRWESKAPLGQARMLYKKLRSSGYWSQDSQCPRALVTSGTQQSLCPRCGGTGYLPQYSHVQYGICFLCWATGGKWGTEMSEGPISVFAKACDDDELEDLYNLLKLGIQKSVKLRAKRNTNRLTPGQRYKADLEMEKIREWRKLKAEEKLRRKLS